ncbi:unnamed protein product [Rhizoctonia solani]|uniref:Uncharacterized protein n=1 Tax=Rhizoctonia solani TaxID=456999 RepID=A0A8H3D7D8_9AGAM|nr:unnamed protein product [Rhizoctonia solani]
MARRRIRRQGAQLFSGAAILQLDVRLALELLDIHESATPKYKLNTERFVSRIEQIYAGNLTVCREAVVTLPRRLWSRWRRSTAMAIP